MQPPSLQSFLSETSVRVRSKSLLPCTGVLFTDVSYSYSYSYWKDKINSFLLSTNYKTTVLYSPALHPSKARGTGSVLSSLFSALCSLFSVLSSLFSALCSLFSVLSSLFSVLCSLFG